jgi:hypothetical protein
MHLETQRLNISPLTANQLLLYIAANGSLEKDLNLNYQKRTISINVENTIQSKILPALNGNLKHDLFLTFWTVIDRYRHVMVADMCFKGPPNDQGKIEIGYGTHENFQGNGFMTEALDALLNWAFQQENVKCIVAETALHNMASIRILEKNNFVVQSSDEFHIYWELNKTQCL